MGTNFKRGLVLAEATLLIAVISLALLVPSAWAARPDLLLRVPQEQELPSPGGGAGAINNPRGVVGSPATGHFYVADSLNARINEYTAWGLFVKSWGWDVAPGGAPGDTLMDELETCGPAVPVATPDPDLCKEGVEGSGGGQLARPNGLAVDSDGNVYVIDRQNQRVQKFTPTSQFVVMFGGDVNKTKVEGGAPAAQRNVCPIDPGDVCQAGISGEEPGQLEATIGDYIAYSPNEGGTILVGDKGGIQVFDTNGNHKKTIAFAGPLAALAGKTVNGLDVDSAQNIYITLDGTEDVFKLSPVGTPLDPGKPGGSSFEADNPLAIAVDMEGSVYVIHDPLGLPPHVLEYSDSAELQTPTASEAESGELFPGRPPGTGLTAIAANVCESSEAPGNLYTGFFNSGSEPVSYLEAFGTAPIGCEPPPPADPVIGEQFATFVGYEEAILRALINPKFWPDTAYYVEYGTGKCFEGNCSNQAPSSPELLTERSENAFIRTVGVILGDLVPATTYHYRFVAQSSGGGPVLGPERTFRTQPTKSGPSPCPNDPFRIGPGADLPDCRAYEMVSPLDKGNADVALGDSRNSVPYRLFEVNRTAPSGERFTYSAATPFASAQSSPFSSQYLAERDAMGGWESKGISPSRTEAGVPIDFNFGPEFMGFTDDLCRGWLRLLSVAPLVPEAVAKYPNLYRRDNCAEPPFYEALTTVEPPNRKPEQYVDLLVKGFSADGGRAIFTAPDKLHPDAPVPNPGEAILYEHGSDGLRFVCYLPSGDAIADACSAGTPTQAGSIDLSGLHNAISGDGSRIFWTPYAGGASSGSKPGRIFLRIEGNETAAVSEAVSPDPAFFWSAADDGSKAIFSFTAGPHTGELYEFDVDTETATLIAEGVEGPMGASEDASRVYFASTEDLDGAEPATAGDQNLYFREAAPGGGAGSFQFVMVLATVDVSPLGAGLSSPPVRPVSFVPAMRAARVTPDGQHVTFMSAANPTPGGYDNRDAETGKVAAEVYRYDAAADELHCVSCNPTGARPAAGDAEGVFAAARIQGWEVNNHAPRVISDDGSRVFFESHEALVPDDANGTWDVYQWEEPGKGGVGGCTEDKSTFHEANGGCIDLISSGKSASRSLFLDADPSGENIFFSTQSSLVSQDYGLNDVYVARVGGGFPPPPPPIDCEGESCQNPPPPPPVNSPASESFVGPGNETGKGKGRRPCPKGKRRVVRKGKARCVKKRSANKRRSANKGSRR